MSSHQVIDLSDSNEETDINKDSIINDDGEADFEFPAVQFHYLTNKPKNIIDNVEEGNIIGFDEAVVASSSLDNFEAHANNHIFPNNKSSRISDEYVATGAAAAATAAVGQKKTNKPRQAASGREAAGREHEKHVDLRRREKYEIARDKCIKALERKIQRNIQPGECMKFMQVSIDREIEKFPFHTAIIHQLQNSNIHYRLDDSLEIKNSITWIRKIEMHYINSSNEICTKLENQMTNQIMVIWNWDETVKKIKNCTFFSSIEKIVSTDQRQIILIIYGMEEYFRYCQKIKKQTDGRKNVAIGNQAQDEFEGVPKISRHELQLSLTEVQLILKCNNRLVETTQELAILVYQFTKAIAEIPLKLEKMQKTAEKIDWYAMGDNRDTVRVEKTGIGLKRLWQQQLCQFNLASLETAEAISSVYPSPRKLMQAYATCTQDKGEILLRDISIRRAAGPLSTVRKIGLELSKKVFIMFTSTNGEMTLGNDREL